MTKLIFCYALRQYKIGAMQLPSEVKPNQSIPLLQALHILTRDGKLIASVAQEGLMRPLN